jgi:hypothetical protein
MEETRLFWTELVAGMYDVVISTAVLREIDNCPVPKGQMLYDMLDKIEYTVIDINEAVEEIANEVIKMGILTEKKRVDCRHIGGALYSHCRYLVSWNITDLVKVKTINGVRMITQLLHYPALDIITPSMLISREEK